MEFSLILPTYNESENILKIIKKSNKILKKQFNKAFEIIIIDDNSQDGTKEILKKIKNENIKIIFRNSKLGLGSAYKEGFKLSKGNLIGIMDSDGSHSPSNLIKMIELHDLSNNCIVYSSRYHQNGDIIGWNKNRKLISKFANFLSKKLLNLKINDITGSFRIYSRSIFKKIFENSKSNFFDFQLESIFIAKKFNTKFIEFPIIFINRKNGKSKL